MDTRRLAELLMQGGLPEERGNRDAVPMSYGRHGGISNQQGAANFAAMLAGGSAGAFAPVPWHLKPWTALGGGLAGVGSSQLVGQTLFPEHSGQTGWHPDQDASYGPYAKGQPDMDTSGSEERIGRGHAGTPPVNGFANEANDASEVDRQIALQAWMDANPMKSGAMATAAGALDGATLGGSGTISDWLSHESNRSRMRGSHPYAYRTGQAAGVAPWFALGPQAGAAATGSALYNDPLLRQWFNDNRE